jgi:AraC-like DNA-binding protein
MRVLRTLCGPNWAPIEVTLARVEPADKAAYRRHFGTSVRFEAHRYAIVFHSHWLDRPIPAADSKERTSITRLVNELERSRPASMTERTRETLTRMLVSTCPSVVSVAQVLNVSPRTLNRRLADEGTTFKALLEEARHALARQLLRETHLTATEISAVLHYTTPSAFSRAFKHWEDGLGPRRLRTAHTRSDARELAV